MAMRDDVKQLIESRPSWRLANDQTYKDLLEARSIAAKENDHASVQILDHLISEQKLTILNGLDPKMFSVSRHNQIGENHGR
jgi:hypothetical protein